MKIDYFFRFRFDFFLFSLLACYCFCHRSLDRFQAAILALMEGGKEQLPVFLAD